MSSDPQDFRSDVPPEYDSATPVREDVMAIKGRVQVPAIALIVVGVLNLLLMVLQVGRIVLVSIQSPQELAKERDEILKKFEEAKLLPKEVLDSYKQQAQGMSPESFKNQTLVLGSVGCVLGLLIALLPLLGGIRMLSMRSYALCIVGAISAAIPCLSCGGCCCFGEIIGIWALIVLLNAEVREAFR